MAEPLGLMVAPAEAGEGQGRITLLSALPGELLSLGKVMQAEIPPVPWITPGIQEVAVEVAELEAEAEPLPMAVRGQLLP